MPGMLLIIDNTKEGSVAFSFLLNNKFVQRIFKTGKNPNLAASLEKFLSGRKVSLKNIKYLGAVVGAGRFTATRLAVTFVNTLAFALKIPVIALSENFAADPVNITLKKVRAVKVGQYATALYSGEARVGMLVRQV